VSDDRSVWSSSSSFCAAASSSCVSVAVSDSTRDRVSATMLSCPGMTYVRGELGNEV
jgi:hypothetical protein